MKTNIEIVLKQDNAFDIEKKMNRYQNIDASSVSTTVIRLQFDDSKVSIKKVLKLVMQAQGTGIRKKNVQSVKEIHLND